MSDPQGLVDRIGQLLASGDQDGAAALVASASGAAQELGRAQLALARQDLEAGARHAKRAQELGVGAPAHHFLAVAKLMGGDADGAVDEARKAVGLDGSPRSRSSLGGILLGAGRFSDALAVLRQVASETPDDPDVNLNLGSTAAKTGDYAEAVHHYARAFALRPTDQRPIQNLMGMYAELGRWMGAMAALDMSRQGSQQPPDIAVTLDLVNLHLVRLVSGGKYPPAGMANDSDDAVRHLIQHSESSTVAQQITIARTLIDFDRTEDAKQLLSRIDPAKVTGSDRASLLYLAGLFAQDSEPGKALEIYQQALDLDGERVDAAVNAISLLLEQNDPSVLPRIQAILDKVTATQRSNPDLLYNEAIYLVRAGKPDDAKARLERVVKHHGNSPRGERARQALADLRRTATT